MYCMSGLQALGTVCARWHRGLPAGCSCSVLMTVKITRALGLCLSDIMGRYVDAVGVDLSSSVFAESLHYSIAVCAVSHNTYLVPANRMNTG